MLRGIVELGDRGPSTDQQHPAVGQQTRGMTRTRRLQRAHRHERAGCRIEDRCPSRRTLRIGSAGDQHLAVRQQGRRMAVAVRVQCAGRPERRRLRIEQLGDRRAATGDQHPAVGQRGRDVPDAGMDRGGGGRDRAAVGGDDLGRGCSRPVASDDQDPAIGQHARRRAGARLQQCGPCGQRVGQRAVDLGGGQEPARLLGEARREQHAAVRQQDRRGVVARLDHAFDHGKAAGLRIEDLGDVRRHAAADGIRRDARCDQHAPVRQQLGGPGIPRDGHVARAREGAAGRIVDLGGALMAAGTRIVATGDQHAPVGQHDRGRALASDGQRAGRRGRAGGWVVKLGTGVSRERGVVAAGDQHPAVGQQRRGVARSRRAQIGQRLERRAHRIEPVHQRQRHVLAFLVEVEAAGDQHVAVGQRRRREAVAHARLCQLRAGREEADGRIVELAGGVIGATDQEHAAIGQRRRRCREAAHAHGTGRGEATRCRVEQLGAAADRGIEVVESARDQHPAVGQQRGERILPGPQRCRGRRDEGTGLAGETAHVQTNLPEHGGRLQLRGGHLLWSCIQADAQFLRWRVGRGRIAQAQPEGRWRAGDVAEDELVRPGRLRGHQHLLARGQRDAAVALGEVLVRERAADVELHVQLVARERLQRYVAGDQVEGAAVVDDCRSAAGGGQPRDDRGAAADGQRRRRQLTGRAVEAGQPGTVADREQRALVAGRAAADTAFVGRLGERAVRYRDVQRGGRARSQRQQQRPGLMDRTEPDRGGGAETGV